MKKYLLFLSFFALPVFTSVAQEKLTMQQAITIALEKNIDVIRSRNTSQIQSANVTTAVGNFLPSLSASASWNRNGTSFDPTSFIPSGVTANGSVGARLNADVTLFDGFRNTSSLSRANASAEAAGFDFEKQKQNTVLAVQQAYLTVLRNKQLLAVSEDNLKQSRQQLSRIEESNKVGAVAKADLFRQQVQTANDELTVINAQSAYDNSKSDLLYLISMDVTKEYDFDDEFVLSQITNINYDSLQQEYSDFNKLVQQALEARPDYQASILSKNIAQSDLSIAKSGHYPTLSLGGSYGIGGDNFSTISDTKSWSVGLTFSVPIFSGFQTSTQVQTSQLNFELADQSLDQAKRQVAKEIRNALLNLETSWKRNEVAKKSVVSATEDRRIAQERYNLGANTLLDLLVATSNYTKALSDKVNASYDFLYAKQLFKVAIGQEKY
jgi:outer membrane protein